MQPSLPRVALACILLLWEASSAAPYAFIGQSTEDLVGAFSIEKTIRLGDSGCLFEDASMPSIAQAEIEPQRVNVTGLPQAVDLTMEMEGDLPSTATAEFISPTGQEELAIGLLPAGASTYHGSATLPAGSEPGLWRLYRVEYMKGDQMGNITDPHELSFLVESVDRYPPHLIDLRFEPKTINRLDPQPIEFQLVAADASALSLETNARFASPSGSQTALVRFSGVGGGGKFLPSEAEPGAWTEIASTTRRWQAGSLILSPNAEPGAWMLLNLTLLDTAGNCQVLCREELIEAGLPAEFMVE